MKVDKVDKVRPFLRWTGSKTWLTKEHVLSLVPKEINKYHEPFLGGGSIFFYLQPEHAVLSDINEELTNTYLQIKENVDKVIALLKRLKNTKDDYYRIRSKEYHSDAGRAARFIYLNRTSFNGIYRVNPEGKYNVPYGYRENVNIVTEKNLRLVSQILSKANILNECFSKSLERVEENDFVYLDPPYTVAHENNGFIEYNSKLFSWDDQERLAESIQNIVEKGAYFMLSNAEHRTIRELYKEFGHIHSLSRYSRVGGRNHTRGVFNEVVITNLF